MSWEQLELDLGLKDPAREFTQKERDAFAALLREKEAMEDCE